MVRRPTALAGQARIALRAAAERAKDLGSRDQAVAFLESAARLPGEEAEQLALLEAAADVADRLEPAGPGGRPVHGDPGAGPGRR